MSDWKNIKKNLYLESERIIQGKIKTIKDSLNEAQDAANNETKSSAGDKHETGRAMAQLETEKLTTQLSEALKLEQVLDQINPDSAFDQAALGSLIITDNGNFYLAVSLGKIELNKESYYAISGASPIGKLLLTKKEKESFSFNGKSYFIEVIV